MDDDVYVAPKRPQTGAVRFTPLPRFREQTALSHQRSASYRANTSYLPPPKPKLRKITPVLRQRAIDTECGFLNELFRSAGGTAWKRQQHWASEKVEFAEWEGVECVEMGKFGEVQYQNCLSELWLGANNLRGSVPPAFFWQGVPQLSVVELGQNPHLGGGLPQLSSLQRLVVLDVRGCRFEGNVPQDMPPALQRLLLANNKFDGLLPRWNLPKLRVLNLSHNKLSGLAEVGVFADMSELEVLDAQSNLLQGEYATMWARALPHDIVSLSLARNKLYGPLGSATLGAASLEYLDLSTNNLTGPLSEDVGSLTLLRDLRLSGNKLTGSFPRDVTRLRRLRCLSLKDNNLVGPLDAVRWGNLAKTLEELDLSGNANLEGRLEALPPFDPDAPAPFKFRGAFYDSDEDDGTFEEEQRWLAEQAAELAAEKKKKARQQGGQAYVEDDVDDDDESATADDGSLSMAQLEEVAAAKRAAELALASDFSPGALKLRRIGALRRLKVLDLSRCGLKGPLPKSVCWLDRLTILRLDFNNLGGPLPRLKPPRKPKVQRRGSNTSVNSLLTEGDPVELNLQTHHQRNHQQNPLGNSASGLALQALLKADAPPDDGFDLPDPDAVHTRGGFRGLSQVKELGLSHNHLEGPLTTAVLALPRGVCEVRLEHNSFEERRPKLKESHFGEALAPHLLRLVCAPRGPSLSGFRGTLNRLSAHHNDLGRSPKGTGERGWDPDDSDGSDGSDGEGGEIDSALKKSIAAARARQRRLAQKSDNEDTAGRPLGLTPFETERAIRRQRWCVNHTQTAVATALESISAGEGAGARGCTVILEPALNDKLAYNQESDDGGAHAIKGFLGRLRHDLTQVLIGRADEIPDYSSPPPKPPRLTAAEPAPSKGASTSKHGKSNSALSKGKYMLESDPHHRNHTSSDELAHMLHPLSAPAHDKPKREGRRAPRRYPPYNFEYQNEKHADWDI